MLEIHLERQACQVPGKKLQYSHQKIMIRTLASETIDKIEQKVLLKGWIHSRRDHGKVVFIDLRDRTGLVQVVGGKDLKRLRPEFVVEIEGRVKRRPNHLINPNLHTGTVEVEELSVVVLNQSKEMPFPLDTDGYNIEEEIRLKYRYLDLRRKRLQRNIRLRSAYVQAAREYLFSNNFIEIETPILTKSTPEGSRDFITPSRLQPEKFFALPQSPQQYKQLLMTAGFERYFQIARCLRDEDPRADRGFEHTQIDMEMSFTTRKEVMQMIEDMTVFAIENIGAKIVKKPFPVFTYNEALKKFGADKFDLRSNKEQEKGLLSFAWVIDFPFFEKDGEGNWTFTHNPFSQPVSEDHEKWLLEKKNIGNIITSQYDLVCNGLEVSGGSIRSHRPEVLRSVFEILGYSDEQIEDQFGHMLQAFEYGTPPHGGCAQGFERLLMAYFGEDYLREVQAFPQTGRGRTSIMDAPSTLDDAQLEELHIKVISKQTTFTGEEVLEKISELLKKNKAKFKSYKHEPIYTSEQAAKVRGTKLEQGAKALIMYTDKKPAMLVLSAATRIDNKTFKKLYNVKDLHMASAQEVIEITGIEIGAIPPFGNIFELPVYVDEKLKTQKTISFNAGLHSQSIDMRYQDYEKIVNPTIGSFSK